MSEAVQSVQVDSLLSTESLNGLVAYARVLAASSVLPAWMGGGKQREANCLMIADLSMRMGRPFLEVARAGYEVYGNLGFSTEFFLAGAMRMRCFKGAVNYEVAVLGDDPLRCKQGDLPDIEVVATALDAETEEKVSGVCSMRRVVAEGWANRKGTKYTTDPAGMLKKRAVTFLLRDHYPQALWGQRERDELDDIRTVEGERVSRETDDTLDRLRKGGRVLTVEPSPDPEPGEADRPVAQDADGGECFADL